MKLRPLALLSVFLIVAVAGSTALAHCQIPCGIYNDPLRITMLEEHITTIEKSMKEIESLSQQEKPNWNQIVRWVDNKEQHADAFTEIVSYYFLTQRVKPADPADAAAYAKYVKQLTLLHQMMVLAMKAKQTTDLENCAKLRALLQEFAASYFGEQPKAAGSAAAAHSHADAAGPSHAHR